LGKNPRVKELFNDWLEQYYQKEYDNKDCSIKEEMIREIHNYVREMKTTGWKEFVEKDFRLNDELEWINRYKWRKPYEEFLGYVFNKIADKMKSDDVVNNQQKKEILWYAQKMRMYILAMRANLVSAVEKINQYDEKSKTSEFRERFIFIQQNKLRTKLRHLRSKLCLICVSLFSQS
jgi:hypothetical protein